MKSLVEYLSENKKDISIVFTGFEPFNGRDENESYNVAKELNKDFSDSVAIELPVEFDTVNNEIKKIFDKYSPKLLCMFGEHPGRKIKVEKFAKNRKCSTDIPDNNGETPLSQPVINNNKAFLGTNIEDIDDICDKFDYRISVDAKSFVCNTAYFDALNYVDDRNLSTKVIFIHVSQTENDTEKLKNFIKELL